MAILKRKNVSITVPQGLWKRLERHSNDVMEAKSRIVETALRDYLDRRKNEESNGVR